MRAKFLGNPDIGAVCVCVCVVSRLSCRNLINKTHIVLWLWPVYFDAMMVANSNFSCWCLVPSIICDTCRLAKIKFILCPCCVAPTTNEHTHSLIPSPNRKPSDNFNGDFSYNRCYSFQLVVVVVVVVCVLWMCLLVRFGFCYCLLEVEKIRFGIQYSTHLPLVFTPREKYSSASNSTVEASSSIFSLVTYIPTVVRQQPLCVLCCVLALFDERFVWRVVSAHCV